MYSNAVITGILISMLFTEFTNLSAGLIIPGYFALCFGSPKRIAYTILIAMLSSLICKYVSNYLILYGRRRFAFLIVLTFILDLIIGKNFNIIGNLVPGILAREFDRQGYINTLLSVAITTLITSLMLIIIGYNGF